MLINFISDNKDLKRIFKELKTANYVSVDTESNSLYTYEENLCLLQIETNGSVYIIDPLNVNISQLSEIFANQHIEKIFHSAICDISLIKKTINSDFYNIFDVMIASKYMFGKGYSLRELVRKYIGVEISKRYQKINWAKRPLKSEYIEYAAYDVIYLKEIRDKMYKELLKKGVYKQFKTYCRNITEKPLREKRFNPDKYLAIARNYGLDNHQALCFVELAKKREEIASQKNIPPFRIMSTSNIASIVKDINNALEKYRSEKFSWIFETISNFKPDLSKKEIRQSFCISDPLYKDRIKLLKIWRNKMGEIEKISPELILSKGEISKIARYETIDKKILSECGLDEERIKRYSDEIIHFYNSKRL